MVKVVSEIGKDQRVFDLYHVDALTAHACNLVGAVTLKQRSHELWRLEHALPHSASSHVHADTAFVPLHNHYFRILILSI